MKSAFDYINEMNRLWFQYTPNEWEIKNLGYVSKMIVPMRDKPTSFDGTVPWVRIEDFDGKYISDSKSKQYVSEEFIKSMNLKVFPKGTVMCTCSCTMGATAIVEQPLVSNQTFIGIVPSEKLNSEYLYYLMQASADRLQMFSQGAIQQYLSRHDFEHLKVPLPSIEIQKKIKNFLNKKLESLDKLIHNKNNLLKLLEQQRQSIITEAVTKGLNSNVKMKDSGVEWIDEIPEHWETKALKYCFKVGNGKEIDVELDIENESGINVYGSGGIFKKTNKVLFEGESVLFGRKGTIGKPLYVNDVFWTVDTMYYTEFYKKSYPKWFYYLLLVYPWDLIITQTALPSVVGSDVANTICAIPSFGEQVEIAEYLSLKDEKHFKLVENINNQIQKLKEYRQALIYEAVTGKIDVREMEID